MRRLKLIKNLIADESGGEVLEYALIAGLIVVADNRRSNGGLSLQ
jgi:hypothetical protein